MSKEEQLIDRLKFVACLGVLWGFGIYGTYRLWNGLTSGTISLMTRRHTIVASWPDDGLLFGAIVAYWSVAGPFLLIADIVLTTAVIVAALIPKGQPKWRPTYDNAIRRKVDPEE